MLIELILTKPKSKAAAVRMYLKYDLGIKLHLPKTPDLSLYGGTI